MSDLCLHFFNRVAAMLNEKQISHIKSRLLTEHIKTKSGCWEWQGAKFGNRYGYITIDFGNKKRRNYSTHRLSAFLFLDFDIDSKILILHECDNPPCINPEHLFSGTHRDNRIDCVSKGRNPKTFSEEAKKRMSVGCKKRPPLSEEARKKITEANKGKKRSLKAKANMSNGQKKRWENPKFREQMMQVHLGAKRSAELVGKYLNQK